MWRFPDFCNRCNGLQQNKRPILSLKKIGLVSGGNVHVDSLKIVVECEHVVQTQTHTATQKSPTVRI